MRFAIICFILVICLSSCEKDPAKVQIQNNLPNAVLKNVSWGEVALSSQLLPGEVSDKVYIYYSKHNNIKLPDQKPVRFYMELKGDMVYLETRNKYHIDYDQNILITIEDTTKVFNPLTDKK